MPQKNNCRASFDHKDYEKIEKLLDALSQVIMFSWKWDGTCLVLIDLMDKPITFTRGDRAIPGLEMFLLGYDIGFGHGRTEKTLPE